MATPADAPPQTLEELANGVRIASRIYQQAHQRWNQLHADLRDAESVVNGAGQMLQEAHNKLRQFLEQAPE